MKGRNWLPQQDVSFTAYWFIVPKFEFYERQSCSLLKEIETFGRKKARVFKHIEDAIGYYRSRSDGGPELFSLREKGDFKAAWLKLACQCGSPTLTHCPVFLISDLAV